MITWQIYQFASTLSFRLHRMHESGLMNKWVTEQIPTKDKCSDISANQGVNERKVNVADMQGIFFVLFMGNIYIFFLASIRFKSIISRFLYFAFFRRDRIDISPVLRVLLAQTPSSEATQIDSTFSLLSLIQHRN